RRLKLGEPPAQAVETMSQPITMFDVLRIELDEFFEDQRPGFASRNDVRFSGVWKLDDRHLSRPSMERPCSLGTDIDGDDQRDYRPHVPTPRPGHLPAPRALRLALSSACLAPVFSHAILTFLCRRRTTFGRRRAGPKIIAHDHCRPDVLSRRSSAR